MDIYNDIKLVQLSVKGDGRAFEHLVKRHYMTVYKVSYKWCGVKEDAEDITQEVFITVYQKLSTFDPMRAMFSTWLFTIARNKSINYLRRRKNSF